MGGFSDGASYALSFGIGNGHPFGTVLALSPWFRPALTRGEPRLYASYRTDDAALPIDRTSRVLVPRLKPAATR